MPYLALYPYPYPYPNDNRLRGIRLVPFESRNLRFSDAERTSRSPVQDSLEIDFVRLFK